MVPIQKTPTFGWVSPLVAGVLLAMASVASPLRVVLALAFGVLVLVCIRTAGVTRFWQILVLFALTGYVVLNYGFANYVVRVAGIGLPLGHLMVLMGLFLYLLSARGGVAGFLREPITVSWLVLAGMSLLHLVGDLPRFGVYAVRDASFVIEGTFMLLGYGWARSGDQESFLQSLTVVFLVNLIYSLTFLFRDSIAFASPVSGIFLSVPLLGYYAQTSLFLLAGASYYLLVAQHVVRWPRSLLLILAVAQAGWLLVFQSRAVYVGVIATLALLFLVYGPRRKAFRFAVVMTAGAAVLFGATAMLDLSIEGRVGQVDARFLIRHLQSLLMIPGTPGFGTSEWRLSLFPELWMRWTSNWRNVLFGEGFGQPLLDFALAGGIVVRQPHNTHVSVLMRLGLVGFAAWVVIYGRLGSILVRGLRRTKAGSLGYDVSLWLLLFFVSTLITTTVQPWLEFSYGAVPFFIILGFSAGLLGPISCDKDSDGERKD